MPDPLIGLDPGRARVQPGGQARITVTLTNTGTLVDCQNCHFPHGSAAKTHLRMEKAVACKQCHS